MTIYLITDVFLYYNSLKEMEFEISSGDRLQFKNKIIVINQNSYVLISQEKIAFCKADGSYSKIYLDDGSIKTVCRTLISIERCLNNDDFVRCHYSFLINIKKIEEVHKKKKIVIVSGHKIPISKRRCFWTISRLKAIGHTL